jgi:hypothetical protein
VTWKGKDNPVTGADRAASRFLVGELRDLYPATPFFPRTRPIIVKTRVLCFRPVEWTLGETRNLPSAPAFLGCGTLDRVGITNMRYLVQVYLRTTMALETFPVEVTAGAAAGIRAR